MSAPEATVLHGDCVEILRTLPEASIDAIVTDPPYGLGFMGKKWDELPPGPEWAAECLRVLKPGGHLLAFGGTRTWHRLAVAVEDAGFEIRDSIAYLYGSGFPKSLDVSKAIDKAAGAEREIVGTRVKAGMGSADTFAQDAWTQANRGPVELDITVPSTAEAERWQGWGTALKPAFEPIVVGRKPLSEKNVASNVLTHGTGAINLDACRVQYLSEDDRNQTRVPGRDGVGRTGEIFDPSPRGRFPANVILDESQAAALDEQSGTTKSRIGKPRRGNKGDGWGMTATGSEYDDTGGASRFFYSAKASAKERVRVNGVAHPTVKPLSLMRYLVRLVTPPGGVVLDTFAGSGTTLEAALDEGFDVIGIEREEEYLLLIHARIARARGIDVSEFL